MEKLNTFKKVVLGNQITWDKGELFIWNVPCLITPTYTYINLIHRFKQKCPETNSILFQIGKEQAALAVEYAVKKFGVKNKPQIINFVLGQSSLLGYGLYRIINLNLKEGKAIFKCGNNPFAKYYKVLYGTQKDPVDYYIGGTLVGILEATTNEKWSVIETGCMSLGKPYCSFELNRLKNQKGPNSSGKRMGELEKERKIYSSPKPIS